MGYQRREHRELQVVVPQAQLDKDRRKPYTPPPSAADGVLAPQRRRTAIKAKADPANPAVMRTVGQGLPAGQHRHRASSMPGSSMKVFHMTLTPCRAFIPR